jgi:hypothetical protein
VYSPIQIIPRSTPIDSDRSINMHSPVGEVISISLIRSNEKHWYRPAPEMGCSFTRNRTAITPPDQKGVTPPRRGGQRDDLDSYRLLTVSIPS